MVHIKAYRGTEIRRFEIEAGATFAQLKEMVGKLFSLGEDDTVAINYCDRDGDIIRLSSDAELLTAMRHLGEEDTWKLQVVVEHKQPARQPVEMSRGSAWWDWNPFHWGRHHMHHGGPHRMHHHEGVMGLFGPSFWNDDPFDFGDFDVLRHHQQRLHNEQQKRAEVARRHAMRQSSVDAKRAADEVQQASEGQVAEKKPKVMYRHFGSWEPKVEKGDNYVVTTYGPVGYEVHYSHDSQEGTKSDEQQKGEVKKEEEPTKME